MEVTVPYKYIPRFYQLPFLEAMDRGCRRAVLVWHRKSGKTKTLLNFANKKAFERVGAYYHMFPEYNQGRKVIWDGIDDETGQKYIDLHIPQWMRKGKPNNTEMKITLRSGSIYQIVGADNYDSLVGPNPVGLIFDEWALSDRYPKARDFFMPILANNGGWAVWAYTPRGRNHGWDLYSEALRMQDWFTQILGVNDTHAITDNAIEEARSSGMSEDMIQQEFYCSFLASTANILIPFDALQSALRRDSTYQGAARVAGLDVARFGDDRTAFIVRQAGQLIQIETWRNLETTQIFGKVNSLYRGHAFDCVAVDVIGLGAGVFDMLKNAGVPCVAVNVSESPSVDGRFVRLRDELWWKVREWFLDRECSISKGIPEEKRMELIADIQDIHYAYDNKGLIKVESKDDMKERLKFSPDIGDALCTTFSPAIDYKVKAIDREPYAKAMKERGYLSPKENERSSNPLFYGLEVS